MDAVCSSTSLAVIVYNRANAVYSADTVVRLAQKHENFIGFKDATGDIEAVTRVVATAGDRLFYLGGLPTAETFALPMLQLGMSTYSSALYNFAPGFALEFYADVRRQDRTAVTEAQPIRPPVPRDPGQGQRLWCFHREGWAQGSRPAPRARAASPSRPDAAGRR